MNGNVRIEFPATVQPINLSQLELLWCLVFQDIKYEYSTQQKVPLSVQNNGWLTWKAHDKLAHLLDQLCLWMQGSKQ